MTNNDSSMVAPELRPVLDFLPTIDPTIGLAQFRQGSSFREPLSVPAELAVVRRDERFVPGSPDAPEVRVLIYTPPEPPKEGRPAVLHLHGGGYIMGNPEINDLPNRQMALEADCVVVSVDYRLAPETRFPGALEDAYAALVWLAAEAEALGIDTARIAIAGESAGGGHAAALAVAARDRGGPPVAFLILDSPMLDDRTCTQPDPHPHVGRFVWTPELNRFGWQALLGVEPGSDAVPANGSPARADPRGLPPTFISVGALDLFMEESLDWIRRLTRAGVAAELHVIPGAFHGYNMAAGSPQVDLTAMLRLQALRRAFAN